MNLVMNLLMNQFSNPFVYVIALRSHCPGSYKNILMEIQKKASISENNSKVSYAIQNFEGFWFFFFFILVHTISYLSYTQKTFIRE